MNKKISAWRWFVTSLSAFAIMMILAGCGFHLRAAQSFPEKLRTVYYQADAPYSQLSIALKKQLKSSGVTLIENMEQAPVILTLSAPAFSYKDVSAGSTPSTQARVYELAMSATFGISGQKGRIILEPQNIATTHSLTLNANEIFSNSTQVAVTKQFMQKELITKILDVLTAKKVVHNLEAL